jgi:hypothetical protein
VKPVSFLAVGEAKIFRDDIYGRFRFPFRADHKLYREQEFYDFPQKDYRSRLKNSMMMLLNRIPSMRKDTYTERMKAEMIKPLQNVIETK